MEIPKPVTDYYTTLKKLRNKNLTENVPMAFAAQVLLYACCLQTPAMGRQNAQEMQEITLDMYPALEAGGNAEGFIGDLLAALGCGKACPQPSSGDAEIPHHPVILHMVQLLTQLNLPLAERFTMAILALYKKRHAESPRLYYMLSCALLCDVLREYHADLAVALYENDAAGYEEYLPVFPTRINCLYCMAQVHQDCDETVAVGRYTEQALALWHTLPTHEQDEHETDGHLLHYSHCIALNRLCQHIRLLEEYTPYVQAMPRESQLYTYFCRELAIAHQLLNQMEPFKAWVQKGLAAASLQPDPVLEVHEAYYYLLYLSAFINHQEGEWDTAMKQVTQALGGLERLLGKLNEKTVLCLVLQYNLLKHSARRNEVHEELLDRLAQLEHTGLVGTAWYNIAIQMGSQPDEDFAMALDGFEKGFSLIQSHGDLITRQLSLATKYLLLARTPDKYEENSGEMQSLRERIKAIVQEQGTQNPRVCYLYHQAECIRALYTGDTTGTGQHLDYIERELLHLLPFATQREHTILVVSIAYDTGNAQLGVELHYAHCCTLLHNLRCGEDIAAFMEEAFSCISYAQHFFPSGEYAQEIYHLVLARKYLRAQYYCNFMDNPANQDVGFKIAVLEAQQLYMQADEDKHAFWDEKLKELLGTVEYSYKSPVSLAVPKPQDIRLPAGTALFELYCYRDMAQVDEICLRITALLLKPGPDGVAQLYHLSNFSFERLLELSAEETLQAQRDLAELLLGKLVPRLEDCHTLYYCADLHLHLLVLEDMETRDGLHVGYLPVIQVASAYDVQPDFYMDTQRPFVLGNPAYAIDAAIVPQNKPLPGSEKEAYRLAEILGTSPVVGARASKDVLAQLQKASVVHLATHGELTENAPEDITLPLDAAFLALAGLEDWLQGEEAVGYGNGLLSAQEISAMQLSHAPLVVLSTCNSGNGLFDDTGTLRGLPWAFCFAGARACIAHIDRGDDVDMALFSILLYRRLMEYPIGHALYMAKFDAEQLTVEAVQSDPVLHSIYALRGKPAARFSHASPFKQQGAYLAYYCQFNKGRM